MRNKKLKKLPIGIQTFKDIRDKKENYIYVDKTDIAYELIDSGKYYFLSRPRRFGKSLFLDTLKSIFEGSRELFEDLAIYDKWDWDIKYPVIKISFAGDLRSEEGLKRTILGLLSDNQERLDVNCKSVDDYALCFKELIQKVYKKENQKVVVLIDEYDKPILDNLDQMEVAVKNREIIKSFYTILKDSDEYLKFVFLTGVSKFSKASIFSGLNMLEDISLNPDYGNICGYTQKDIETSFLPYLKDVDLEKLKVWYNGYNFLKDSVYNPFDILLFIKNKFLFDNYWFSTGTPTFLIKLIKNNNYFLPKLSNLIVNKKLLDSFDVEKIDLEVILYQAGYLTIDKMIEKDLGFMKTVEYKLKLPNLEVKVSLSDFIIDSLLKQSTQRLSYKPDIYFSLLNSELDKFKNTLVSIFASIPYNNYTNNDISHFEGYYASVLYVYLQSLGLEIIGEDITNRGRIDLTLKIENLIYIIEFKMGGTDALAQIKSRNYAQKYMNEDKDIYLLGINFDDKQRNISQFKWEKIV